MKSNQSFRLSLFVLLLCYYGSLNMDAQDTYEINIDQPQKEIIRGHLDLGGKSADGEEISVNNFYIERNGKPFIPIIGEFHYSRFPQDYWEEELLKMKSGGINVVATYVFWNIHEREEGKFDWSGDLNLKKFLELAEKHDIDVIVRMGPFCHGEMRNGGMPDWLYGRTFEVRSNDPEYLKYVDVLYGEIANQIKDHLFKDGGAVVGVQLENEYQHTSAPWEFTYPGSEKEYTVADLDADLSHEQITVTDGKNPRWEYGKKHMQNLKEIAKRHGIDVPLYTATGWGNATIVEKGSLPVTAGYAYPFWTEPNASKFYLFKDIRKSPDYGAVSYNTDLYPSIPAEIGPGIQAKFSRRPIVPYESVNPLMVRILGSGSNGIGYYMYHGGSTPQFNGKYYNEEVNGLPRINYDFQAPLGQYGQVRYHYKHLRMLHQFVNAYGETLAPMQTILPETNTSITPENNETLRYAVRSNGNSGFLFLINFQDDIAINDINNVNIKVQTGSETISFPSKGVFNILKNTSAILPFNLKLDEVTIKSATVQPLTVLHNNDSKHYIFSAINGIDAELSFTKDTKISKLKNASVVSVDGLKLVKAKGNEPISFTANGENMVVLPQDMAINALKIGEALYVSDALIVEDQNKLQITSQNTDNILHVFPDIKLSIDDEVTSFKKQKSIFNGFGTYKLTFEEVKPAVKITKVSDRKYALTLDSDISKLNDVFVNVDYVGDRGLAFIDGEMINDHFYQERKWEISLKGFASKLKNNEMVFVFHPMYDNYTYLKDLNNLPKFEDGKYLKINGFEVVSEYKTSINLK
ncbi:beta-galactosidase [Mariniflexile sp. HNIBRBA6329]|uniref:beta-galactosidase n=1 Tax=Mariniflexile sp. HNIBRBA6329 TaxID=3373088 RepID=UPI003746BE12